MRTDAWLRGLARALVLLVVAVYFAFALIFLSLRYVVLPHIEDYRADIEHMLSGSLDLPVSISGIAASWDGLRPHLALSGFVVRDSKGRVALDLHKVDADVSWTSLLHLHLRLKRLEIDNPSLSILRDAAGRIFVAGLQVNGQSEGFSGWLLAQHHVVVRDATIVWHDELRDAPSLALSHVNFNLINQGSRHRFALTADPPKAMAASIDVRGDFRAKDFARLSTWHGEAYAELDYANLAVWRNWVDYPIELSRGSGGVRLWLDFDRQQVDDFTADVSLQNVEVRLADNLPLLDLQTVSGRLSGKRLDHGFEAGAQRLSLTTVNGIEVAPTDFRLLWSGPQGIEPEHGELTVTAVDLGALSKLAAHLPFDTAMRKRLAAAAPQGTLSDLRLAWSGPVAAPSGYSLNARFADLGMRAMGRLPGFAGVSGTVHTDDSGGSITLSGKNTYIDLPAVFPKPRVELESVTAQASWRTTANGFNLKLASATFANRDAAGSASGSYVASSGAPGVIDLNATLTRANGGAVWRYLPRVVDKDVRDWVRHSIVGARSSDTTLRLQGDLAHFPFAHGSGVFDVKSRFSGGTLRYAPNWPQIDHIDGELEFVGSRMIIRADHARIYGVDVKDVEARIDDLAAHGSPLVITGKASGATAEFLRFVEASPVGEHIDHFTRDLAAAGNGQLSLKLALPLSHLADSKVDGSYQFAGNVLSSGPGLPPLTDLTGRLQFSNAGLTAKNVQAIMLGMPVNIHMTSSGGGTMLLTANGDFNIAALRTRFPNPLLDHLSGSAIWRGTVRLRRGNADISIETPLVGISSSLPEPFNKSANAVLPLKIERKLLPEPQGVAPHDEIDVALGKILSARFFRRLGGAKPVVERGAIAVGESLALPDKGVIFSASLQHVDVDYWRKLFSGVGGELPLTAIGLKAKDLSIYGHDFHDLSILATPRQGGWHAELNGPEAAGDLDWKGQGAGRLVGHLKRFALNESGKTAKSKKTAGPDRLPGLGVEVDHFVLHGKSFGRLKIDADNVKGIWQAKLNIDNEDGKLSGTETWQPGKSHSETHLKFTLNASSVEKLLARLGYPNEVKRGKATLEGELSWNGSPFSIDYPSLGGSLNVLASNGQFNKLEPGAGRLLGILSLQALPRRITLDFRDVFSAGFAFDTVAGQIKLAKGVMDSKGLNIQGPSAKILMTGSVDLPRETQNLRVKVQPTIGESLSIGAILMAHPAVGAISYIIQKLLRDPIDKAFAYEYEITGRWADPKVVELAQPSKDDGKTDE